MSTKAQAFIVHPALGGLDTMSSPALLDPGSLQIAENVEYFTTGSKKKRLGTIRGGLMEDAVSGGNPVVVSTLMDFWHARSVATSNPQFFVGYGSGVLLLCAFPGSPETWAPVFGTSFGSAAANYSATLAQAYVVFTHDLGTEIPKKYGGTASLALSDLDDCAPKMSFTSYHLSRLWGAGVKDSEINRSRLYFSAAGDITDWEGEDSSSLYFDIGDGDDIVGISKPFRGALYVFKGPYYGSVHVVTGRVMRQFTRDKIVDTAPCVSHRSIVTTPNDIYWLSPYGIHSMAATQKYGNTEEAYVSHKIKSLFPGFEQTALEGVASFYHPTRNLVGWFLPESGQTQNTVGLIYNYVLGHWSIWRYAFNVASCMVARDPTTAVPRLFLGGYDGYVRTGDHPTLVDDGGTAYTARVKFPVLTRLGDTMNDLAEKSFQSVTTFFNPTATNNSADMNVTIDGRLTTFSVNLQAAGDAFESAQFDISSFGDDTGLYFTETPIMDRGRAIQLEYINSGANKDMEIFGYAIRAVPAEGIAMEAS